MSKDESENLRTVNWPECHQFDVTCHLCGIRHLSYGSYCDHLKAHYGSQWLCCEHCGKVSAHKSNFISHVASHTGRPPYRCKVDDCTVSTSTRQNLISHIRKTHKVRILGLTDRKAHTRMGISAPSSVKSRRVSRKRQRHCVEGGNDPSRLRNAEFTMTDMRSNASLPPLPQFDTTQFKFPVPFSAPVSTGNSREGSQSRSVSVGDWTVTLPHFSVPETTGHVFPWNPLPIPVSVDCPTKRPRLHYQVTPVVTAVANESAVSGPIAPIPQSTHSAHSMHNTNSMHPVVTDVRSVETKAQRVGSSTSSDSGCSPNDDKAFQDPMDALLAAAAYVEITSSDRLKERLGKHTTDWAFLTSTRVWDVISEENKSTNA